MSKWTNLLLDVNYMKQYAKNAARVVTINIAKFGEVDEDRAKDAVMARFWLDKLLLDESDLIEKWGQPVIHSFEINSIVFRGTEQECINWLCENDSRGVCEIYYTIPDETQHFSWSRYFKECGIEVI